MTTPPNLITRRWTRKSGEVRCCYYYRKGRAEGRALIKLGSDYAEAVRKYAGIIGVQIEPAIPNSVEDVYRDYMKWATTSSPLSTRTIKDRQGYWANLGPVYGQCCIDELEPGSVFEYFELRSSQASAKKELKFLQTMCNWAKSRGKMRGANPCSGIMQQLPVSEGRSIYVEDTWYQLALKHSSELIRNALEFTYLFANRPDETSKARFDHIEGDELVIQLAKTKGKGLKEKRIHLDGPRLDFISRMRKKPISSFYIVSDEQGQRVRPDQAKFKAAWKAARDAAAAEAKALGIPFTRFQLRDIRAKAATDIARDHGIEAARLMLGHTTQKQTAAYIRSVKGAGKMAFLNADKG